MDAEKRCCWETQSSPGARIVRCRRQSNDGGIYCDKHCEQYEREHARDCEPCRTAMNEGK